VVYFTTLSVALNYITSKSKTTHEWKDLEGSVCALIAVLSRRLPGGAEEDHDVSPR
jgi:hypothetical protein